MRFVQPAVLLLGSAIYVGFIVFVLQLDDSSSDDGSFDLWILVCAGIWNILMFAATIIAIVDSVRAVRAQLTRRLAVDAMVAKLVAVPFFVLNFAFLFFLFQAGLVTAWMGIGFVAWIVVAIAAGMTYLTMLSTSIYVWATIAQLRKQRIIGTGLTVLYAILSLAFRHGHRGGRPLVRPFAAETAFRRRVAVRRDRYRVGRPGNPRLLHQLLRHGVLCHRSP